MPRINVLADLCWLGFNALVSLQIVMTSKLLFCRHIAHTHTRWVGPLKGFIQRNHSNRITTVADNWPERHFGGKWLYTSCLSHLPKPWTMQQQIYKWSLYAGLTNRWAQSFKWKISLRPLIGIPCIAVSYAIKLLLFCLQTLPHLSVSLQQYLAFFFNYTLCRGLALNTFVQHKNAPVNHVWAPCVPTFKSLTPTQQHLTHTCCTIDF